MQIYVEGGNVCMLESTTGCTLNSHQKIKLGSHTQILIYALMIKTKNAPWELVFLGKWRITKSDT